MVGAKKDSDAAGIGADATIDDQSGVATSRLPRRPQPSEPMPERLPLRISATLKLAIVRMRLAGARSFVVRADIPDDVGLDAPAIAASMRARAWKTVIACIFRRSKRKAESL